MRYAIYFVPDPDSELAEIGARWLGYDVETGSTFAAPVIGGLPGGLVSGLEAAAWSRLVCDPVRYGLHATLKAPFRLAEGCRESELVDALRNFARALSPVRLPVMSLMNPRDFFALMPAVRNKQVEDLSASAMRAFEPFRAPLDAAERARRQAAGLTDRQQALLARWGYPYVLDAASFHITLTGTVAADDATRVETILTEFFEPVLGRPMIVDRAVLVVERNPGARFEVLAAASLGRAIVSTNRAAQLDLA